MRLRQHRLGEVESREWGGGESAVGSKKLFGSYFSYPDNEFLSLHGVDRVGNFDLDRRSVGSFDAVGGNEHLHDRLKVRHLQEYGLAVIADFHRFHIQRIVTFGLRT